MEHASKALLIAGTILIAIMTVSLLMLSLNKVSDYQASSTKLAAATELAKFNEEFTQYIRNDVKGVELIALLNKVEDYNNKGIEKQIGELDYTKKIEIQIKNFKDDFKNKYGATLLLQNVNVFTLTDTNANTNGTIMKMIKDQRSNEDEYGRTNMSVLASNEEGLRLYYENYDADNKGESEASINKQKGKSMETVLGKKITGKLKTLENMLIEDPDEGFKIIDTQTEFANFKTSKFKCTGEEYYTNEAKGNGQVKKLSFEFVK